jgi:hypothetical protein
VILFDVLQEVDVVVVVVFKRFREKKNDFVKEALQSLIKARLHRVVLYT